MSVYETRRSQHATPISWIGGTQANGDTVNELKKGEGQVKMWVGEERRRERIDGGVTRWQRKEAAAERRRGNLIEWVGEIANKE